MEELTVQELLDYLLTIKDKTKKVVTTNDMGDDSSLYIDGESAEAVYLGQCYED